MSTTAVARRLESILLPLSVPMRGDLSVPDGAKSLVVFAHGLGSSRRSPRNQWVAAQLQNAGYATLLFDLLLESEEESLDLPFDLPMLAQRLAEASDWATEHDVTRELRVGYFGASTGAAASMIAAAARPELVRAVVSRGGRPDLAGSSLGHVHAPTRLIVGELDYDALRLNRSALARLGTTTRDLVIVPGASHLFEETGTLARVASLAVDWFNRYLGSDPVVAIDDEC